MKVMNFIMYKKRTEYEVKQKYDIAFVADDKVMSGTAENILRRFLF